ACRARGSGRSIRLPDAPQTGTEVGAVLPRRADCARSQCRQDHHYRARGSDVGHGDRHGGLPHMVQPHPGLHVAAAALPDQPGYGMAKLTRNYMITALLTIGAACLGGLISQRQPEVSFSARLDTLPMTVGPWAGQNVRLDERTRNALSADSL